MVPPLANLAVLCLADIALDTDPDGADEGADEAPPRPLQEVSVRRHQLSPSVKCPSYCFTSSSLCFSSSSSLIVSVSLLVFLLSDDDVGVVAMNQVSPPGVDPLAEPRCWELKSKLKNINQTI